ncbi:MAG: UDP-N-acetylmuramate dehydrogenase [Chitinophagaceae bacterium]|nr:MAG: UDP-N-acetylmuramate dehydrogenase [Chitinophagaceae bacterium]
MKIHENYSLKNYNTFRIDAAAKYFSCFNDSEELKQLLDFHPSIKKLILGGGSNLLFTKNFDGLVLKNEIKGIEILNETEEYVDLKVGAGENWHEFVLYCIEKNWAGVENLSLIPGTVGAAPIQNIGAYGVEFQEVFLNVEAFHFDENWVQKFSLQDCCFGYRNSIFKNKLKTYIAILNVSMRLKKQPIFQLSYGSIKEELEKAGVKDLSIRDVSNAVIKIRSSKLPDPTKIANAGSFFKNPEVTDQQYKLLKELFPQIVSFQLQNGNQKLAAGWLVEQCGPQTSVSWKGYRDKDAGCHEKQALVLVNHNQATGKDIYDLSEAIIQTVQKKFGIMLEREVNIV